MNTEIMTISALSLAGVSALAYAGYGLANQKFTVKFNEEGILYKKGKFQKVLPAGEYRFFGSGYELIRVDNRMAQLLIQLQEIITQDQITIKVSGVIQYKIIDSQKFNEESNEPLSLVYSMIQLALRDAVSEMTFEEVNVNRREIAKRAMLNLGEKSLSVGIEVKQISVRDFVFPNEIRNAYHDTLCAQKRSLAKLEAARGEVAAARAMANASKQYAQNPEMMQLKYLEVLKTAADGEGNTFILSGVDELPKVKAISVN